MKHENKEREREREREREEGEEEERAKNVCYFGMPEKGERIDR